MMTRPPISHSLVPGLALAVSAAGLVLLSPVLDLRLETTLIGAALGAALGLISERSPLTQLVGGLSGLLIAWVGYVIRAQYLPATTTGHAVAVLGVMVACTVLVVCTRGRLPLWAPILGAGGFAGVFELTYAAAPQELVATSLATGLSLLVSLVAGFLVAAAVRPQQATTVAYPTHHPDPVRAGSDSSTTARSIVPALTSEEIR